MASILIMPSPILLHFGLRGIYLLPVSLTLFFFFLFTLNRNINKNIIVLIVTLISLVFFTALLPSNRMNLQQSKPAYAKTKLRVGCSEGLTAVITALFRIQ